MWGILWYIHRQPSVTRIPCHSPLPLWAHQPSWYLPWIIHELPVLFCEKSPCWLRKSHGNPRKRNMCVWKLVIYGYTVIPQFMAMFGRENMEKWGLTWINPWFFRATMFLHRSGLWPPKKNRRTCGTCWRALLTGPWRPFFRGQAIGKIGENLLKLGCKHQFYRQKNESSHSSHANWKKSSWHLPVCVLVHTSAKPCGACLKRLGMTTIETSKSQMTHVDVVSFVRVCLENCTTIPILSALDVHHSISSIRAPTSSKLS